MLGVNYSKRSRSAGFTLIELVVAMIIVGIALAAALPNVTTWIQNAQIRTAAENAKNGLQLARMEAVKSNSPVSFTLSNPGATGGTGWTIRDVRTGALIQSKPDREGSPKAVLNPTADATTVTFTGLGRRQATNVDGSPVLTMIEADNPSSAEPRKLDVTISVGGEIRMCDPAVTDAGDPRRC
jgi:type IV fimbrial biogenesis protein FimT